MFFVTTPLKHFWQILDPAWLKEDLFGSLLNLHAQPPVFNFLVGLGWMQSGKQIGEWFDRLYQFTALGVILLLYLTQRKLSTPLWLAWLLSTAWMLYPAFIYFQNFLFYPLLVQFLLLLAALLLGFASVGIAALNTPATPDTPANGKSSSRRLTGYLVGFFLVLFLLFATRSSFNIVYVLLVLVLLLLSKNWNWKIILAAAAPTLVLLLVFTLKNLVLFGQFSTSSWLGMNLANVAISGLSQAEREALIAAGKVSPAVLPGPFNPIDEYPDEVWKPVAENCQGPPALCQPYKTNGEPNLNFIGYIPISQAFLEADLYALLHYPGRVLRQAGTGWRIYFSPALTTVFVNKKALTAISPLAELSDRIFCGQIADGYIRADIYSASPCYRLQGLYLGIVLLASGLFVYRTVKRWITPVERVLLIFILFTLVYSAVTGAALDLGENNRFRFETDALVVLLLGYALNFHLYRPPRPPANQIQSTET